MRSGSTTTTVPSELTQTWSTDLGGKLSAPVMAGGKVYVCSVDRHEVYALDASSGKPLWSYTADGRIDSPPTIHAGMAIFGGADGWVYCLRASDGQLAWRFRAAPGQRSVMSHGQLESAWPVSGSVLVVSGAVFCTAGRSSFVDGGMYTYALDAATGRMLQRQRIHEVQPYTSSSNQMPAQARGALADILLTDGQDVYLRHRKLDLSTPAGLDSATAPRLSGRRLVIDGGFLDDFWFHRAYWRLGGIQGNLIVFDERNTYAAAMHQSAGSDNYRFYVPAGGRTDTVARGSGQGDPSWLSGAKVQHAGYHLFAATAASKNVWHDEHFPICPLAMVASHKTLFVAGFPDQIDSKDPWATFEGRRGGLLRGLSTDDGETLAQYRLDSPPVWNGMAAAEGRLFITLKSGNVVCLARPQ